MNRVLVTGGAGFIGSHVVDRFVARGDTVAVLDNFSSGKRSHIPAGVSVFECAVEATSEVFDAFVSFRPNIVVHAAAQVSVRLSMDDPIRDLESNGMGILSVVLSATAVPAADGRTPHVVFISSGGAIYGEQSTFPAPESHRCNPTSAYGLTKLLGEGYLSIWERSHGLESTSLRLANVYGPRQDPHGEAGVVAIFIENLLKGAPLTINGDGQQTRDFVFVHDVVDAIVAASIGRVRGCFNVGTGVEITIEKLASELQHVMGTHGALTHGPAKLGEQRRSVIDPSLARAHLGVELRTPLAKGLSITVDSYR